MTTIIVEAETLESARAQAASKIPEAEILLSEVIESDGKVLTVRGSGTTSSDAESNAQGQVPQAVRILERTLTQEEKTGTATVTATDERSARAAVLAKGSEWTSVVSIVQVDPGKSGFLGIGRRSARWEAIVQRTAEMEIRYQRPARIVLTTGTTPQDWSQLVSAMRAMTPGPSARKLADSLPYHVQFILASMKLDQPGYYNQIPFVTVTPTMVASAKQYVHSTKLPGMLGLLGQGLDANRFQVVGAGKIGKMTNPVTDSSIVGVASCLPRVQVSMTDEGAVGRLAFDAIKHYADLPAVRFCFSLPYLDATLQSRQIDPTACLVEVYKATEALLLEIWDDLPNGGRITDDSVLTKARSILTAA